LSPQANSTACGRDGGRCVILQCSTQIQREQAARGIEVDVDLALQALHQDAGAFVVQGAPPVSSASMRSGVAVRMAA
jgi:hypothetical protein